MNRPDVSPVLGVLEKEKWPFINFYLISNKKSFLKNTQVSI